MHGEKYNNYMQPVRIGLAKLFFDCMHGLQVHAEMLRLYNVPSVLAGAAKTAATAERIVRQTNAKRAISILD